MSIKDFIIEFFCKIDNEMKDVPKHPLSNLYPSEIVTIAVLFAIKSFSQRAFYRWLKGNFLYLFPKLPERTRLFRLIKNHQDWTGKFIAKPTIIGVADTYGIELIHPIREGRSKKQIGRKEKKNHHWIVDCIVGVKVCVVVNKFGIIFGFKLATANVYDTSFRKLIRKLKGKIIVLIDSHFHSRNENDTPNMKMCKRERWNERMVIETVFSMMTRVFNLKRISHRVWEYLRARVAFSMAAFNILASWGGLKVDKKGFVHLSIAQFSL